MAGIRGETKITSEEMDRPKGVQVGVGFFDIGGLNVKVEGNLNEGNL